MQLLVQAPVTALVHLLLMFLVALQVMLLPPVQAPHQVMLLLAPLVSLLLEVSTPAVPLVTVQL